VKATVQLPPDLEHLRLLNEKQVSELTGIAVKSLQNARWRGDGIPVFKIGKSCRYRLSDCLRYVEARRIER
jgi:hypothetical protein